MIALAAAVVLAFFISACSTPLAARVARRFGMIDVPQRHKAHANPTPLLGGCAIFGAILGPTLLATALASIWASQGVPDWLARIAPEFVKHVPGAAAKSTMALVILLGALVLHVVGIIDDRRNLGPILKLIVQILVATGVVIGTGLTDPLSGGVRILTVADQYIPHASSVLTILWLVVITNSFNFLDNMDGLAAGVAAICCAALLAAAISVGQVFVSAWLCLMLGALLGFLPFNFAPARIFMGDAGSLVIGYMLAVLTCLTTYAQPNEPLHVYHVLVPLVLLAVPLYDTTSVMILRIRERRNPMVGDRRHFSHRLVRRGMSTRSAVLTIYLCTFATAIGAMLLPHVANATAAWLIGVQTLAILLVVAVLERPEKRS